jgi:hypothetical protein
MAQFTNPNFETNLAGWEAGQRPTEISGNKTTGWFDASQITGLNDGDEVLSILDSSGNNNTLSRVGTGPIYKTGIRNGLPVMRFNNTNEIGRDGLGNYPAGSDPFDLFMVASPTVADDTDVMFMWGLGQPDGVVFCIYRSASDKWYYEYWGGPSNTPFGTLALGSFYALHGDRVGNDFSTYLNGTFGASFNNPSLGPWNWTTVGSLKGFSLYFTGDVSEYIITKGLSTQEKADVSSYLALKWDLPLLTKGGVFTRDTGIKYAGAASLKAVAIDDTPIGEMLNTGTGTQKIQTYAYTDGSPVTSADIQLYYDGAPLTTTYASVGGGWYKLKSSFTGVASDKKTGAIIKAGKTVYTDNYLLGGVVGPFPTFLP